MSDRTMVKLTASGDYIVFRTVSMKRKSPHFYVRRSKLLALSEARYLIDCDGSFAKFTAEPDTDSLHITFHWIDNLGNDKFSGRRETVIIPLEESMRFVSQSAEENGPRQWYCLSQKQSNSPHLIFHSRRNLKEAVADKTTRHKLVRFLRDHFNWYRATEIVFTDDFVPRSFFFTEYIGKMRGTVGGVILHGQENMATAEYEIHT